MIRSGIGQTFEAFGVGLFRLHWLLTVMAFMSFSMNFTVLPIVAFDLGGTNSSVALAMAGNGIAWFFIGPFAGALTDRLSKRRLIVLAQTAIAINYALIGFLIVIGRIEVIWLTVSTLFLGACFGLHGPVAPRVHRRHRPCAPGRQRRGPAADRAHLPAVGRSGAGLAVAVRAVHRRRRGVLHHGGHSGRDDRVRST